MHGFLIIFFIGDEPAWKKMDDCQSQFVMYH